MSNLLSLRVLDLTDEKGLFCGKVLADLGAEVIKIEKPGGDGARRFGPFYHDMPDPDKSLLWFAYNTGKKGITLDIESADGQEIFRRLAARSDVVVESFAPGYLDSLGLGYSSLSKLDRRLVMCSVSPFGQEAPYRDRRGSDLAAFAMSGMMYLCGDADRAPLKIGGMPQSWVFGSAYAALAVMTAYYHRETSGEGQYIDVSMVPSLLSSTANALPFFSLAGQIVKRRGQHRTGFTVPLVQRQIWPCKDGFISFIIMGGRAGLQTNRALVAWMAEEGMADDFLLNFDWASLDMAKVSQDWFSGLEEKFGGFFLRHTKEHLWQEAIKRGVMLYPVASSAEIAANPHLQDRDFWARLEHPELGEAIAYPGPLVNLTETPIPPRSRAPLLGEHNSEIYCENLGLSPEELETLQEAGVI